MAGRGRRRSNRVPRRSRGFATRKQLHQDFQPIIPISRPMPQPSMVNARPGYQKVVRTIVPFVGAAISFTMNSIAIADAADVGSTVPGRAWTSVRLKGVRIWGPLTGGNTDVFISVSNPNSSTITSGIVEKLLTSQVDNASTSARPFIGWNYGEVVTAISFGPSIVANLFTIFAASPTGDYVIDYHVIFN